MARTLCATRLKLRFVRLACRRIGRRCAARQKSRPAPRHRQGRWTTKCKARIRKSRRDIAKKFNLPEEVIAPIETHHDDHPRFDFRHRQSCRCDFRFHARACALILTKDIYSV